MTKILLVEDDKSLREIYGVRLLAEGYDIVSAGDGEEALAMAIKDRPNLIISDVMMPKISGFDMLDILRSTTETRDIKVIMMTALSSEDQRARGESLGADRYLVKSQVGIEDVVRTVHEVLGDAPVTSTVSFGQPQPTAGMRPAPTTAPAPRPMQQPVAAPQPTMNPTPQPQPQQPVAPVMQPPAPQPQPVSIPAPAPMPPAQPVATLPQPTAPFSTARPANLGDRVIQPITPPAGVQNLGSRMDEELGSVDTQSAPQPIAPPVPPAPAPFGAVPSMPPAEPVVQFEETPRQIPPTGPGPQQPGA
jgi:CheY-like chemotaxis protein